MFELRSSRHAVFIADQIGPRRRHNPEACASKKSLASSSSFECQVDKTGSGIHVKSGSVSNISHFFCWNQTIYAQLPLRHVRTRARFYSSRVLFFKISRDKRVFDSLGDSGRKLG